MQTLSCMLLCAKLSTVYVLLHSGLCQQKVNSTSTSVLLKGLNGIIFALEIVFVNLFPPGAANKAADFFCLVKRKPAS